MGETACPHCGDGGRDSLSARSRLSDDEFLWRRIHERQLLSDGRVSSAAFSGDEMSVDVARIQSDMSITLADGAAVGEIVTAAARDLGQDVVGDPQPDNRAHALVIGPKPKSVRRALRDAAQLTTRARILSSR